MGLSMQDKACATRESPGRLTLFQMGLSVWGMPSDVVVHAGGHSIKLCALSCLGGAASLGVLAFGNYRHLLEGSMRRVTMHPLLHAPPSRTGRRSRPGVPRCES